MLCSSAQCSSTQCLHACVVVLALVPGHNIFWVWEKLPFPDFLGRFFSRQAASGISECSVAASLVHCRIIHRHRLMEEQSELAVHRLMEEQSELAVHRLMEERSELVFRCLNS